MRHVIITGALLIAISLAGCADGSESAVAGTTEATVEVTAEDIGFAEESYEAAPGTVTVRYHNDGAIEHTLLIDDIDGFKLTVASNGDDDEGTTDLEAGSYVLYCDVAGHREAGMEATLQVG